MADEITSTTPVELATELTIAWLGNPNTQASSDEVPAFLKAMYDAVRGLDSSAEPGATEMPSADYTPQPPPADRCPPPITSGARWLDSGYANGSYATMCS